MRAAFESGGFAAFAAAFRRKRGSGPAGDGVI